MSKKPYYITTAIAYTSGKPHIGNTYEIILADSIARFKRLEGYDVRFQTGTDEHGQKIEDRAAMNNMTPKQFVDETAAEIKRIWDLMNTSYDRFIRTTDEDHEKIVQKIFKKLYEQDDIYKSEYEGMYCKECESFYTPSQVKDGKCPECGFPVHPAKEEAYFLRMSKYADRLIEHINTHPEFIQPVSRKNEIMNNFLLPGLQDLCVSRTSFKWGIPVDFDDKHVIYVWIDALSNYITGLGYHLDEPADPLYEKYWPADVHLIGKDILRFHTIYWPIMLMALGVPLPKQVFGHPWLNQNGEKMSKSKGNVIYADDMADLFGVDAVRYFVLHETPFESDGLVGWDLMIERYNSDLANTLGNLVNRTISMINKYFGGSVRKNGSAEDVDLELAGTAENALQKSLHHMETLHVADAITEVFTLFKRCNKYIDETTPWVLAKDEEKKDRLETVLYNLAEGICYGASLLFPFMPETAEKIASFFNTSLVDFEALGSGFDSVLKGEAKVTDAPEQLFARLDEKEIMAKVEVIMAAQKEAAMKLQKALQERDGITAPEAKEAAPEKEDAPVKAEISYDDFAKMDFRVGVIEHSEAVPKSKKLLCSKVRVGGKVLQIVSGIHMSYEPEELIGKKVMVLVNLKPATLAGVVSEGMLICADDGKGGAVLLSPEKDVDAGELIS